MTLFIIWFVLAVLFVITISYSAGRAAIDTAEEMIKDDRKGLLVVVNEAFKSLSDNDKKLRTHIQSLQSALDKYKSEVDIPTIHRRIELLNYERGGDTISRINALEKYLKVKYDVRTEKKDVPAGMEYRKMTKKDSVGIVGDCLKNCTGTIGNIANHF